MFHLTRRTLFAALFFCFPALLFAQGSGWRPVGPYGGDARSLASNPRTPRQIYLGTTSGWVYGSQNGGSSWQRLSHLGPSDDFVIDHLIVDFHDPQTIFAAAWVPARGQGDGDGGIFISHDEGLHFSEVRAMHGQSVRALAQAPSNPNYLFAGTLKGVYRSPDRGEHWELISPPGSNEIHEIESVAIDPSNPKTIYAGTWHLPWKTTDGGKNWHNIKQGIIDDSDVFSIIVDPEQPNTVFASACSGIYKSVNGGEQFSKVQGIPATARRTRVLMQDPVHPATVYAGTTEGLYRTTDAGRNWIAMTSSEVIVNDLLVDPSNTGHLLMATDRAGVLVSSDGARSFLASNDGITQRQVHALAVDLKNPLRMVAGVVNDKSYGGAFFSSDGGQKWQQRSNGLDGRDVMTLDITHDGSILAGTDKGIFRWVANGWISSAHARLYPRRLNIYRPVSVGKKEVGHKPVEESLDGTEKLESSRIFDMEMQGDLLCVAASSGVFCSHDNGKSWQGGTVIFSGDIRRIALGKGVIYAVRPGVLAESKDEGKSWLLMSMPVHAKSIRSLAVTPSGDLWVAAAEGLYLTHDEGDHWLEVNRFPLRDLNAITYEPSLKQLLVTSDQSPYVYKVNDGGLGWSFVNAGRPVRQVKLVNGRFVAVSLYEGVLMEQQSFPALN
jgi:photosystem II stability/assembly factor-like uncharacterized protein